VASSNGAIKIAGSFRILTALVAWYGAIAAVLSATFGRDLLPVFPLTR
jgi:succinate-acetate transporter protein